MTHLPLTQTDLENFASSFITPELAAAANIFRADSMTGANLIGRTPTANKDYSGVVFSYFLPPDYSYAREYRLRLDNPEKEQKSDGTIKPKNKYLTAPGSKNMFYFPPGVTPEMLADITLPIVICEGAKKALAMMRVATNDFTECPKFLPIAIAGVWNFKDTIKQPKAETIGNDKVKRRMADFSLIDWVSRKVIILFDADIASNFQIVLAQTALAQTLKTFQANVHICSMPIVGHYKGIDDLLGHWEQSKDTKTAIENCLKLIESSKPFEKNKYYLSNGLTIKFSNADRNKTKLTLEREFQILHVDEIALNKAKERDVFIDASGLSNDSELSDLKTALMQLATIKPQSAAAETPTEEKFVLSEVLSDGRIIEALSTNQFAIYDVATDSVEYAPTVVDGNVIYRPVDDKFVKRMLVEKVGDYESEQSLLDDISRLKSGHILISSR